RKEKRRGENLATLYQWALGGRAEWQDLCRGESGDPRRDRAGARWWASRSARGRGGCSWRLWELGAAARGGTGPAPRQGASVDAGALRRPRPPRDPGEWQALGGSPQGGGLCGRLFQLV